MVKDSFTQLGKLIPNTARTSPTMPPSTKPIEKNAWRLAAGNDIADHTAVKVENDIWTITADGPVWGHAVKQRQTQIPRNFGKPTRRERRASAFIDLEHFLLPNRLTLFEWLIIVSKLTS